MSKQTKIEWVSAGSKQLIYELELLRGPLLIDVKLISDVWCKKWSTNKTSQIPNIRDIELHGFCDMSESAYAGVVYLKATDSNGYVHVTLVITKTKAAPLEEVNNTSPGVVRSTDFVETSLPLPGSFQHTIWSY